MDPFKTRKRHASKLRWADLQPIVPQSDLARWIAHQDWFVFSLEEALSDFGYQLRMGNDS